MHGDVHVDEAARAPPQLGCPAPDHTPPSLLIDLLGKHGFWHPANPSSGIQTRAVQQHNIAVVDDASSHTSTAHTDTCPPTTHCP